MLASFEDLRFAVLATSDEGRPYASLIAFAFTPDCQTVIFATPKATRKYRNMMSQKSVSILIDNRTGAPEDLSHAEAVTLVGTTGPSEAAPERKSVARFSVKNTRSWPALSTTPERPLWRCSSNKRST